VETLTPEEELKRLLLSNELDLLDELDERLQELVDRVGDDAALRASVRSIIVDVLRDAGAADHERLSTILAPLMLSSLRAEIRGSRDMMVEALYPLTGRLVTTAVKNAFRELLQTLDSKVTETFSWDYLKVRLEALFSRRSTAELMLQRFPPFSADEMLVIHRPTGLLIARAGDEESVDRDLVGSMLNAVMALTRDAFAEGSGGELSTLEFGDSQLFVKSSPTLILVVVTHGVPPKSFDASLERLFNSFLDTWGPLLSDFDGDLDPEREIELGTFLRTTSVDVVRDARVTSSGGSIKRPAAVLGIVVLVLLAWGGSRAWAAYQVDRVETAAEEIVADQVRLAGYPISVRYDADERVLRVGGLTPDVESREALIEALEAGVEAELVLALNTLPPPPVVDAPDPIADLEDYAHLNVIYFSEGVTPRAPEVAEEVLQRVAELTLDTPDYVRLRVIGYVDPLGTREVNEQLALSRARFAFDRLVELGIAPGRMSLVGRPGERPLTQEVGVDSDSRRTEFEIYFVER